MVLLTAQSSYVNVDASIRTTQDASGQYPELLYYHLDIRYSM